MPNFVLWLGRFFNIFPNLSQNLRNQIKEIFWKNRVILFKIWRKICLIGIWMDHFFWKHWYLYEYTFKFRCGTSLPKTKLECPFGLQISFGLVEETYISMLFFTTNPSKFVKFTIVPCPRCWCGQVWKKKIMPQNSLSLSERESVVGKWRCGISKMTAMRVWHGLRYKTCYNFSENIVSNNYSSCQKSLNSLIQVLSLQAKDRLKFVTRSNQGIEPMDIALD